MTDTTRASQSTSPVLTIVDAYERHRRDLLRLATLLVGPTAAEDVVADAVIAVMDQAEKRAAKGRVIDDPVPYLFRSTSNVAKNRLRSWSRRERRELAAAASDDSFAPDGTDPTLVAAIRKLSPQQRAVIFFTYWADLTPAATAERLDISEGSVRKHLARARAALKKVIS